jgi:zinc protease
VRYVSSHLLYCILFCVLLIALPNFLLAEEKSGDAQRVQTLISKMIHAYGGKEAVESLHSFRAEGKIEALMRDEHGSYDLYFKGDRKLRVETRYGKSSEVRILNGDKAYRSLDNVIEEAVGPRYYATLYQYKHLNVLHDLLKGSYQISYGGKNSVAGRSAEVLRLRDAEGTIMDIYIDEQNFLILKVTGIFTGDNKKIELSSEFSDFRKVGALLFPFQITNYAAGMKIARTVIDKYSVNPDISDTLFEAPHNIQAL